MSISLNARAFSSKENKEFQRHHKAVLFCIENELFFPTETSEFFKGKIDGVDLEDTRPEYILGYIENGVEVEMPFRYFRGNEVQIKVSEIPPEVDLITVKLT